jgi:succinyl-diaminopimelate desuccinylase
MNTDHLLQRIEAKRAEVTALTQDLVRIPTINPPGDAYEACARFWANDWPNAALK